MSKSIKIIIFILIGFMMTGCTNVSAFIANVPTYFDDVKVHKDVVFQPEHNLKLDIYIPSPSVPIKSDSIVFFYGGSWENGDKAEYKFLGSKMAKQGYVVFIPNYRKYPEVRFPDFMVDAADAIKWVNKHGRKYSAEQKSIVIMGHSAGANIATLLITDKSYLRSDNAKISAGIGLSGAYDFTPNTDHLKDIFGPPSRYPLMRPIHFVDGGEPPLFLAYGLKDDIVARFNFDNMIVKLRERNVCVEPRTYPEFDHIDTIANFSWVGGKEAFVFKDVVHFLDHVETPKYCKNFNLK